MSVRLYTDVHVPFAITSELRLRDVDVLTAQEDSATLLADSQLLNRAAEAGRVFFSQDTDVLKIACQWQRNREAFAGVIYAHQLRVSIGQCVADLELIAKATDPEEWTDRVVFLPL